MCPKKIHVGIFVIQPDDGIWLSHKNKWLICRNELTLCGESHLNRHYWPGRWWIPAPFQQAEARKLKTVSPRISCGEGSGHNLGSTNQDWFGHDPCHPPSRNWVLLGPAAGASASCLGQKSPDPAASWAEVVFLVHSRDGVVPLSNQSVLKEINPEYLLEGLMLKLKLQYLGHLMWRASSLEKTLMLGNIEGRRRSRWQRMASLIQWARVWASSRR